MLTLEELDRIPEKDLTLKDMLRCMIGLRNDLTTRLDAIESKIADIDQVKKDVEDLKVDVEQTKDIVAGLCAAEDPFPPNLSVLISGLPKPANEDDDSLCRDVGALFKDGLELNDVSIQAVQRVPPRSYAAAAAGESNDDAGAGADVRPGLVKVRVQSLSQKKDCLRHKHKLRKSQSYKKTYIRNCEDHASRLNRLNFQTLLEHMNYQNELKITGSGRLVRKEETEEDGDGGAAGRHNTRPGGYNTRRTTRQQQPHAHTERANRGGRT